MGNTVLHMMIVYNNIAMYDYLMELAAELADKPSSTIKKVDLDEMPSTVRFADAFALAAR